MNRQAKFARLVVPLLACALLAGLWGVASWRRTAEVHAHLARATRAAQQGQAAVAEAEWQAALRADPRNADIYEMMAQYELSAGQWAQAAASFRSLEKVAPETPHIYCRLAACQLRQDDQKGALETANEELRHDPNCIAALGLVTSLMALQPASDEKLRLDYMRRLAHLVPGDLDFQHMYAEELTNQYRYDELRPAVAHILQISPRDAEAYNLLGYADLASPNQPAGVRQAVRDFQTSLALAPLNGGAHFGLGRAALREGHARDAIAHLLQAQRLRPDAARIDLELSNAYRMAGMTQQADAAKKRFVTWQRVSTEHRILQVRCVAYPKDPQYPRRLGLLVADSGGDPDEAIYYLKKAQQLAPGDPIVTAALRRLQGRASRFAPEKSASASSTPFR